MQIDLDAVGGERAVDAALGIGDAPAGVRGSRHASRMDQPRPSHTAVTTVAEVDPCPWCKTRGSLFWVRSHVQCRACGQVVESCCEGPAGCA